MNKPGRNDPCPCGSGKKFKKCCESKAPTTSLTSATVLSGPNTGPNKLSSLFGRVVAPKPKIEEEPSDS